MLPDVDLKQRWQQLRKLGLSRGLDLILVYFDEYNMADGFYFSGVWTQFERGLVAISTRSEATVLLTGPETARYAAVHTPGIPARIVSSFMAASAAYPNTSPEHLKAVLADLCGVPTFRLGLIGTGNMPVTLFWVLQETATELVDLSQDVEEVRYIKAPGEIAAARNAFRIAEEGLHAALRHIQVGATEAGVAGAAEYAMRTAGAEGYGYSTILAAGERSNAVFGRPTGRSLSEGDLVMVGISPKSCGYCASIGLPVPVQPITAEAQHYLESLLQAYRRIERALGPGIRAADLYVLSREALADVGLETYQLYGAVHSMGLYEAEPPFLSPTATWQLQPGMVLAIDLAVFHPRLFGLRFESGYLISASGAENLVDSFAHICDRLVKKAM